MESPPPAAELVVEDSDDVESECCNPPRAEGGRSPSTQPIEGERGERGLACAAKSSASKPAAAALTDDGVPGERGGPRRRVRLGDSRERGKSMPVVGGGLPNRFTASVSGQVLEVMSLKSHVCTAVLYWMLVCDWSSDACELLSIRRKGIARRSWLGRSLSVT